MTSLRRKIALIVALAAFVPSPVPRLFFGMALAQNTDVYPATADGVWQGTATYNGQQVPLRLEISGSGDHVQGALINGKEKSPASGGNYSDGHLVLHFNYFANTIEATLKDGELTGTFSNHSRSIPITATLNGKSADPAPNPPRIAGAWEIAVKGPKGESAWELHVRQSGAEVEAVIQRIDGVQGISTAHGGMGSSR
jgi:hypothetical protein